jgi:myo-inositol catabolism protein IolC
MNKPLIVFPFDHRGSLGKDILQIPYPPQKPEDVTLFKATKALLFTAFQAAQQAIPLVPMSILVDGEFGAEIHAEAEAANIPHYLTLEASGGKLRLENPHELPQIIRNLQPTGTKILVRYTLGQETVNAEARQTILAAQKLSAERNIPFMLEVLADGPHDTHDENVLSVVTELKAHHVNPQVWKLEGLEKVETWESLRQIVRVDMIVLGRGESSERVREWLATAKKSGAVRGFAVGRTLWASEIRAWRRGTISYSQATELIARNLQDFVNLWTS